MTLDDQGFSPEKSAKRTDLLALITVSLVGFILFLGIVACLPGSGLIFRLYNIPASSMIPTLNVGHYVLVSRAAYGYSRYSFDLVNLPIETRYPLVLPQRGDVVVFKLPRDGRTDWVKRIVGLPGDQIQMVNGRLIINGEMVEREAMPKIKTTDAHGRVAEVPTYEESLRDGESHKIIEILGDTGPFDNTQPFDVPQGHYFMLGDNRDNSTDSRMAPEKGGVGFVPLENLVGRVIATF